MAIGDMTPKEWLQKSLTTLTIDSTISGAVGVRKYITSITLNLQTGGTLGRTITIYKNGTSTSNEILKLYLNPANGVAYTIMNGLSFFLENGQSMSFKQDIGTDVTILVNGIEENLV